VTVCDRVSRAAQFVSNWLILRAVAFQFDEQDNQVCSSVPHLLVL
jgi:hypothetical protein